MIRVDPRVGSGPLLKLIRRAGVRARPLWHRYADFSFFGNGPTGRVKIGVERKTLSEICSAITDSRFVGSQLPGLLGHRADGKRRFDYVFVVVEGHGGPDPKTGALVQNGRPIGHTRAAHLYENVEKFLLTLQLKGGIRIVRTQSPAHTAMWLAATYRWFNKAWGAHKSAYVVDEARPDRLLFSNRTMKRQVANQLTSLAWSRSAKADNYFPSIAAMAVGDPDFPTPTKQQRVAGVKHWQRALQIKKGTAIAEKLFDSCHSRDKRKGKGA